MFILVMVLFSTLNNVNEIKTLQFPTYEKCLVFKEIVNQEFAKSSSFDQRLITNCQQPIMGK